MKQSVKQSGWRRKGYEMRDRDHVVVSHGGEYQRVLDAQANVQTGRSKATRALRRARLTGDWMGEVIAELQLDDCDRLERGLEQRATRLIVRRVRARPSRSAPICIRINTNRNTRSRRVVRVTAASKPSSTADPDGSSDGPNGRHISSSGGAL